MNKHEAKELVLAQDPDFLQKAKATVNGKPTYICPVCGNGSGSNGDGITLNKRSMKPHYKCFKCGKNMDVIELWKQAKGVESDAEAFQQVYNYYNVVIDKEDTEEYAVTFSFTQDKEKPAEPEAETVNYLDFFVEANKHLAETDYYRGISYETLNKYKVGYVENWKAPTAPENVPTSPRLIIPTSTGSYLARDTREQIPEWAKEYEKQKIGAVHLFNIGAIKTAEKPIFVVEGELDALSLIDMGAEAVALGSTSKKNAFIDYVVENRPSQTLIMALDYDSAGMKAQADIMQRLKAENIRCYDPETFYNREDFPADTYKDANEMLQKDKYLLKARIAEAEAIARDTKTLDEIEKEKYLKTATAFSLQDFINGIAESVNTPCIPTGYNMLDNFVLDGGLYEGLYVIGAIPSLGKTTFSLQMADQIAQQGYDVMIFSLEMAKTELIAKSISRETYMDVITNKGDRKEAKTARGITNGSKYVMYTDKEKELIAKAINNYASYAEHIFITEGVGNVTVATITDAVKEHIRITGNKPVVFVDYLQIMAPFDEKASDKQNTDKAVLEFKRLSRDCKIPVIVISSFNRDNYKTEATMSAFKESGAIEYGSDVLIGLQLDTKGLKEKNIDYNALKAKEPREIELVVLKNRNGKTGNKLSYDYYPLFNYFKEV